MFRASSDEAFSHAKAWQDRSLVPLSQRLTPKFITELCESVTAEEIERFKELRAKRVGNEELFSIDSTTVGGYGKKNPARRKGKNKENDGLDETSEVFFYTVKEHMPVGSISYSGNTPDVRTLKDILSQIESLGFHNVILILDRGYWSEANLEEAIKLGHKVVMGVKTGLVMISEKIKEMGPADPWPEGMEVDPVKNIYFRGWQEKYRIKDEDNTIIDADRLCLNIYLDPVARARELLEIAKKEKRDEEELIEAKESGRRFKDIEAARRKYHFHKLSFSEEGKLIGFEVNKANKEAAAKGAGWFANCTWKADEANWHYLLRDTQERSFRMMKGPLGFRRDRGWSPWAAEGRRLIRFCTMVLGSVVEDVWHKNLEGEFDSWRDVLEYMRGVRYRAKKGQKGRLTPFVGKENDIAKAFGFEVPKGSHPEYMLRKTNEGLVGRPRKPRIASNDV